MVTRLLALAIGLAVAVTASGADPVPLTADSLKSRLQGNYAATQSAGERLKASRADTDSLRLLSDDEIQYRLPNGSYVLGMMLPNGKVSPALRDGEELIPACVTTDYALVSGEWDGSAIRCNLFQNELVVLTAKNSVAQVGIEAEENIDTGGERKEIALKRSNKYGARTGGAQSNDIDIPPIEDPVASAEGTQAYPVEENEHATPPRSSGSIYVPPARNSSKAKTTASVLRRDPGKFGVAMGTWVKAELVRPVSSAEAGLIEFVLMEDLVGRYQTMPAGTTVFAEKAINESEKRLESLSQLATLPDGTEIKNVSMRAFSLDKTAGIAGTLVRDREGEFSAISTDAALSTISALTPVGEGVAGAAVEGVTSGVIGNEKKYAPKAPQAVIRVTPQPVLLKVARTF